MTRFPPITSEDSYSEQRRVAAAITRRRKPSVSSRGGLSGPFLPLLYVPGILDRLQNLGEHLRFDTALPHKLRELAIIITARHVGAQIEFHVHAMEAREFGLAEEAIEAIAANRRPAELDEEEALIYDFCVEMYAEGRISDDLFARTEKHFGKPAIIDLIATCGYYKTLGTVLTVSKAPVPGFLVDGFVEPFPILND